MKSIRKRYQFYLREFLISWVTLMVMIFSSAISYSTEKVFHNPKLHLAVSGALFLFLLFFAPILIILFHRGRGTLKIYDIHLIKQKLSDLEIYISEHDFKDERQIETAWGEYTRLQKFAKEVLCLHDMRSTFFKTREYLRGKTGNEFAE